MKIVFTFLFTICFISISYSQIVVTIPEYPTENDSITIIFDATQPGAEELLDYTGIVYAHTGVNTNFGNWQHVIGDWGNNQNQPALTRLGSNLYQLTIGFPREFYNVTNPSEQIFAFAFVFRSANGQQQTRPDIFTDLYEPGLTVVYRNPVILEDFGDPYRAPAFLNADSSIIIDVRAVEIGTQLETLTLFVDNNQVAQTASDSILFNFNYIDYTPGAHEVTAVGVDSGGVTDTAFVVIFSLPPVNNQSPPAGIEQGINYNSETSVTLMLFAPYKEFIFVIGDFNDWKVETGYYMNRYEIDSTNVLWWITIDNITPGTEYAFQYLVDGEMRIGDPYTKKILDPWNDQYISGQTYPNLKPYPFGKTAELVSIFQTGISEYQWQNDSTFQKPPQDELVIYELLLRDFLAEHDYQMLKDTLNYLKQLGVNAIELMPIMEFEGNISWGYNPSFHYALDKYYGPSNYLKAFVDEAHGMGIAVIMDMVLNHAFGQSPMVRMYWDKLNNRPAANSPWFNPIPRHPYNVGYDFNHESAATKYYVDRVNRQWLDEFHIDGFRFDLSKGFTQTFSLNDEQFRQYDQSRINILERMADTIWTAFPDAYVILEHFAVDEEERVLSNYGMMLWGNMNYEYNEATMGYVSNLTRATHLSHGFNDMHLVSYMESHDEERLMYRNLQFGNSSGDYNIRNFAIAIQRIKLAAAFFLTIPGPKMIWQFGELGYDYSINYPCGTPDCRLDPKPIRWDYFIDGNRKNLYKVFQALIDLREYQAFKSENYNYNLNTYAKRFTILDSTMKVNIIGNFYVTALDINPNFPNTGWWYDYFSGDSMFVTNVTQQIPFGPGEFHIYTTIKLPTPEEGILLDVEEAGSDEVIREYQLEQNYPNPFNPTTNFEFQIADFGFVSLKIYDILGREVATLVNEEKPAGSYEVQFDASKLASGVYLYQLRAGDFVVTRKMVLLR